MNSNPGWGAKLNSPRVYRAQETPLSFEFGQAASRLRLMAYYAYTESARRLEPGRNDRIAGGTMKFHLAALGMGLCFGAFLGLLLHNVLFGISIGAALGLAYERRNRSSN